VPHTVECSLRASRPAGISARTNDPYSSIFRVDDGIIGNFSSCYGSPGRTNPSWFRLSYEPRFGTERSMQAFDRVRDHAKPLPTAVIVSGEGFCLHMRPDYYNDPEAPGPTASFKSVRVGDRPQMNFGPFCDKAARQRTLGTTWRRADSRDHRTRPSARSRRTGLDVEIVALIVIYTILPCCRFLSNGESAIIFALVFKAPANGGTLTITTRARHRLDHPRDLGRPPYAPIDKCCGSPRPEPERVPYLGCTSSDRLDPIDSLQELAGADSTALWTGSSWP